LKNTEVPVARKSVTKAIVSSINSLNNSGLLFDSVSDYLKVQVDTEILTIINHLRKIIWGYSKQNSLQIINEFMNLSDELIKENLDSSKFIGFQIFKKFELNEQNLQTIADKFIFSTIGKGIAAIIIDLMKWTAEFDSFNSSRRKMNLFIPTGIVEKKYSVLNGLELNSKNTTFPDRFLLMAPLNEQSGTVVDFGDFVEIDRIEKLRNEFTLNPDCRDSYIAKIRQFIAIVERWLDATNGELIIENNKMFEIKFMPNNLSTKLNSDISPRNEQ
jgi:hypothetical protein